MSVVAYAPGRVNLIGEYVDFCGGPVLPMAIDLGTTVALEVLDGDGPVGLRSPDEPEPASVTTPVGDPTAIRPAWGRYVAGVVAQLEAGGRRVPACRGEVTTTLPIGAGLSSSAALELAVAVALGFDGTTEELALLGQRAEQASSGVPCGVMDQLASASGVEGHALLMDCTTLAVQPVRLPEGWRVLVAHSGEPRELAGSAYADRVAATEAAAALVGPLPDADPAAIEAIDDPVLRRRARHVRSECERVRAVASSRFDRAVVAEALAASHTSLRDDFEVSTPGLDRLVAHLSRQPGVVGARLTGAGLGGCVVALVEDDRPVDVSGWQHWWVQPAAGARRL
jgi:galactokinase